MQETRVIKVDENLDTVRERLLKSLPRLKLRDVKQPMYWQAAEEEKGVISAYSSGKIVVQGRDNTWLDRASDILDPISGSSGKGAKHDVDHVPHIGVDEAGKGDFFGPLVVSAAFVDSPADAEKLAKVGVRDSKKLTDGQAKKLANQIRDLCQVFEVVISPAEYNEQYVSVRNANVILARGHAKAIESLLDMLPTGACEHVVLDQFSKRKSRVLDELMENGRKLVIEQMHGGESDIAVAAASIVARARFLTELEELGKKYDMTFPKGASHVISTGKEFVQRYGTGRLSEVAKTSFKTALMVTSTFDI